MKFLSWGKDGGPKSTVHGFWLVEAKRLFSVALLRFSSGSRDEYHNHAFDSVSWVLRGKVTEHHLHGGHIDRYYPSWRPIVTRRSTFHRVVSSGTTWVLTFRGPWSKTWREFDPLAWKYVTLADGRVVQ